MKAYTIVARDYKAEIVELEILTTVKMPDNSNLHFAHSKFGDDYYSDRDIKYNPRDLEADCIEMNKALAKCEGLDSARGKNQNH